MSTTYLGIDIGTTQICAIIAQKDDDNNVKILGTGVARSQGLKKGIITNIDLASNSIKQAVSSAKRMAGQHYEHVSVSISGAYTKSVDSVGVVNIPNNDIGIREINRAMQAADHDANITSEYEKLHVLPYMFKVDSQEFIEDPLGMNGTRLEVLVHIVIAQKSSLSNLKKAVKSAGLNIDNIVLAGYASSIATLNADEKELGVCLIDMGGSTCNSIIHIGNSIRYNDFLAVGSSHITSDLSMALHTPIPTAEQTKIKYGSLHHTSNELIELPILGDETSTHEVSLDVIHNVIYARVEETLMILAKSVENSNFKEHLGAGVVLTGGFTKLKGIRELAMAIFDNMPIRIAKPKEMEGLYETLKDPSNSVAVGLIMYSTGGFTPYEIDSNRKMRYKDEQFEKKQINLEETQLPQDLELLQFEDEDMMSTKDKLADIADISKQQKSGSFWQKIYYKLTQLF